MTQDFIKYDSGKLDYDILPHGPIEDVIRVMMFGAEKYERDNWKKCKNIKSYYNAARRHMESWRRGEYFDDESGIPHLAHAMCNLVFMHYLSSNEHNPPVRSEIDDKTT